MAYRSTPLSEPRRLAALLGFEGRIGRLAFLGWWVSLRICLLVLVAAAAFASTLLPVAVVVVVAVIPVLWAATVLVVRRLYDLDHSGLHALWVSALFSAHIALDGGAATALTAAAHGVLAWLRLVPGSWHQSRRPGTWTGSGPGKRRGFGRSGPEALARVKSALRKPAVPDAVPAHGLRRPAVRPDRVRAPRHWPRRPGCPKAPAWPAAGRPTASS